MYIIPPFNCDIYCSQKHLNGKVQDDLVKCLILFLIYLVEVVIILII